MLHIKHFIEHIFEFTFKKLLVSVANLIIKKLALNTIYRKMALSVVSVVETTAMRLYSIHRTVILTSLVLGGFYSGVVRTKNTPAFWITSLQLNILNSGGSVKSTFHFILIPSEAKWKEMEAQVTLSLKAQLSFPHI